METVDSLNRTQTTSAGASGASPVGGGMAAATSSAAATGTTPPVVFSRGGTILTPTIAMNVIVWYVALHSRNGSRIDGSCLES
jgi:hypothetical protein